MNHWKSLLSVVALLLAATAGSARADLPGKTIGEVVTNLVQHARASDTNFFAPLLEPSNPKAIPQLIEMILRSGMGTNYVDRVVTKSEDAARLDYHLDDRNCHFQVQLKKTADRWTVARIAFCR